MEGFSKKYEPEKFEKQIYASWLEKDSFSPKKQESKKTFYIPIPPPNVTWVLHLWHALTLTLEDIMVRFHRMKWYETLWVPWTDHAWIATQARVEKMLAENWITRQKLWREEFLKKVWEWKNKYWNTITDQIKMMWASCDWTKERFTLDSWFSKQVTKAFVDLYNKWYIYKWEYMVNYSPALGTVISDQEVVYKEEDSKLYYIIYFVSGSDDEVIVATTRPETLLWDEAVAVNPKDKRYKKLLKQNKKLILPILNKEIPIIADEMVDMDFWTWAVKITPSHDPNDFEVARRHNLRLDNVVIWKDWKMTKTAWIFAWQDFLTARENIVELLKSKWNLLKVEDYKTRVWYCSRSWCRIETIVSKQWFVKVDSMAKKVIQGYKNKDFEIIPNRFNKVFEDWIFNLRDWCISRQLWWGHRIPAYYHKETGEILVTDKDMSDDPNYVQDEDVLDTWFSSALWPFSILDYDIWIDKQSDLFNKFYPAQVLETWHDIIFFWVIRMLLFWYEFTWQTPFKKIYLHWLIRDKYGRKMSKSLWNWIDPLEMIEKYSADALRLTVSIWNTPWNDLKFDEENVKENKIFINKLWNAARFVYTNLFEKWDYKLKDINTLEKIILSNYDDLLFFEKWILSRLSYISSELNEWMMKFNFSMSWIELQNFTKNEFCDYFIEEFKIIKDRSKYWNDVIMYVILHILKMWHPFIPFVTTELYEKFGYKDDLSNSSFSEVPIIRDKKLEQKKEKFIEVLKAIRTIRQENNVMPNKKIYVELKIKPSLKDVFSLENLWILWEMVNSDCVKVVSKPSRDNLVYFITKSQVEVYVDVSNAVDKNLEIQRLKEQIADVKEYIAILDKKLLNDNFIKKAPKKLVLSEIEKKEQAKERLKRLEEKLSLYI